MFTATFWHNFRLYVFVVENLGVFVAYLVIGFGIVPKVAIHLRRTRLGGMWFFASSGASRVAMAGQAMLDAHRSYGSWAATWLMIVIHGIQVVAATAFVSGLYLEFVHWGPWALGQSEDWTPMPFGRARRDRRRRERRRQEQPVEHERRLGERRR
jgi:hypothetical protein